MDLVLVGRTVNVEVSSGRTPSSFYSSLIMTSFLKKLNKRFYLLTYGVASQ